MLLLGACAAGGQVPAADPPAADQDACRDLVDALPVRLEDATDTGRSAYAASWGEPRIVLRCGVGMPDAYRPDAEMVLVNDVAWFGEPTENGYMFTAVGRSPLVEVFVPDRYAPEVNTLVDLAESMRQGTRVSGPAGFAP